MEFHIGCWKKLKTTNYGDKNDKVRVVLYFKLFGFHFLSQVCSTPLVCDKCLMFHPHNNGRRRESKESPEKLSDVQMWVKFAVVYRGKMR